MFCSGGESQVSPHCSILLHLHQHRLVACVRYGVHCVVSMTENHTHLVAHPVGFSSPRKFSIFLASYRCWPDPALRSFASSHSVGAAAHPLEEEKINWSLKPTLSSVAEVNAGLPTVPAPQIEDRPRPLTLCRRAWLPCG